ncbi:MAG: endonuclease [Bacillota bacterium]|nr:endonuclease [Bacillota bacterium]
MLRNKGRFLSFLLILCIVLSLFAGIGVSSFAAGGTKNSGTRHVLCTALSSQAEAYYKGEYSWDSMSELEGVDTDSSLAAMSGELYDELQELMSNTMTDSVSYKSLTSYWQDTDASGGSGDAILFYSDHISSSYNREHVWPKSRGSFYQKNAGSDLHHLRPTDNDINSTRGNHTMGDVVGVLSSYSTASNGGKTVLYYNAGLDLVEVNDDIKGDVARILLYVYVRWGQPNLCEDIASSKLPAFDSDDSDNNGQAVIEDLDTLLEWCAEDPVDTWEMSRNDCVQNIQGNRNVFIDYPEYAWLIFGREVPVDMSTPSGENLDMVSYDLKAESNNEAYGSVSVSGMTVNALPKAGYIVAGAEVYPEGSAVLTQKGSSFTVSRLKSDCTVTVIFEKAQQVTLSYSAPADIPSTTLMAGSSVTLPTCSAAVEGYSFLGWTENTTDETTTEPSYFKAGSSYTVSSSKTLYALYTRTETGDNPGGNAELVTSAPADWSGSYVFGVAGKEVMMTNGTSGKTYLGVTDAVFDGNSITNAGDSNIFTLEKVGGYYAIRDCSGAYLKCGGAKSVTLDSSKSSVSSADTAYLWSIGAGKISSAVASYGNLQYNSSAPRFTTYTSNQTAIGLYRVGNAAVSYYSTFGTAAHSHSYTVTVVAPTCTEQGYTVYTCTCGDSYVADYTDTVGHSFGAWKTLSAATCTEDGSAARYCSVCGAAESKVISAQGHSFGAWKTVSAATCTEDGSAARYCSVCGAAESKVISAQGHSFKNGICTICGYADNPFTDVIAGTPYFEAILWAYHHEPKQISSGFTATEFRPGESCTRGQVVTFLWRAAGEPQPESSDCPFVDVSESSPYRTAIIWAAENNITTGFDATHFAPSRSVTRAQFVTFLWRYLGTPTAEDASNPFVDVSESSVYYPAILWAAEKGVTQGYGSNDFRPDTVCTRWNVVLFLRRALEEAAA